MIDDEEEIDWTERDPVLDEYVKKTIDLAEALGYRVGQVREVPIPNSDTLVTPPTPNPSQVVD
jgi:hypothetical protein